MWRCSSLHMSASPIHPPPHAHTYREESDFYDIINARIICCSTSTHQALALCTKLLRLPLAPPIYARCTSSPVSSSEASPKLVHREKASVDFAGALITAQARDVARL